MDLIYVHFDKILNVGAVIIGGLISFLATTKIEEKKYKRQQQRENLDNILIPFCTSVENTIKNFEKVEEKQIYLKNNLDEWKFLLEYLIASKRVFLTKELKKLLSEYEELLKRFERNLEKEYEDFLKKYEIYIKNKLMEYHSCLSVYISLNKKSEFMIKTLILYKQFNLTLIDYIDKVEFIYNDDPEKYKGFKCLLNDDNRDFYGAVSCNVLAIEDANDDEQKEACYLLEYMYGIKDKKDNMMEIIENYSSYDLLYKIKEMLVNIKKVLLKEIDRIT